MTGASGFIGSVLSDELESQDIEHIAISRGILDDKECLTKALYGVDIVIHLAALAHRLGKIVPSAEEFYKVNAKLTQLLLDAAQNSSVKRFIFVSSISVYGLDKSDDPVSLETSLLPINDYGRSKLAAEKVISDKSLSGPMLCLIVRPPLVFGRGVKGNMLSLLKVAETRLPLPFAHQQQKRSAIGARNLVSALLFLATLEREKITQRTFLVADDEPISVSKVIRAARLAKNRRSSQFWFPKSLLRIILTILGKKKVASQLLDNLIVDDQELRKLGWSPPHSFDDEIKYMLSSRL